ncbi:MAG TPA: DNA methyltransferase [Candidatus Limnocylindria bacterium]|nr:DNA methyltransferase [Candidatus Limnocylindria bacterium]
MMMAWFRALSAADAAKGHKHYNWSDDRGLYFPADFAGPDDGRESRPRYDIIHPITKKPCAKPSTGWRWDEDRTKEALAEKPPRIHFGSDETTIPNRKTYLKEVTEEAAPTVFYKDGRAATLMVEQILGKDAAEVPFPKDSDILADLLGLVADKDAIVLDAFAGSGTTAHSVLTLNQEDNGKRRFVLIEEKEYAGHITAERIRRVIRGVPKAKDEALQNGLGGTFTYVEVGAALRLETLLQGTKLPSYEDLAAYVFYTATGEEFDAQAIKTKTGFIGESARYDVYLFYKPDLEFLKHTALTLDLARKLPQGSGKRRLVFAPTKYVDAIHLEQEKIDFCQLPFEIYKALKPKK